LHLLYLQLADPLHLLYLQLELLHALQS
jgi:hypothetical protein